jgi:hypothetical protein
MANAQKPEVTPAELAHAQNLWSGFTQLLKYGTIITIITVAFLAVITL